MIEGVPVPYHLVAVIVRPKMDEERMIKTKIQCRFLATLMQIAFHAGLIPIIQTQE